MATLAKKGILQERSPQSAMLAKQAFTELKKSKVTSVICPKCQKAPSISQTSNSERVSMRCPCGYLYDMEIYF